MQERSDMTAFCFHSYKRLIETAFLTNHNFISTHSHVLETTGQALNRCLYRGSMINLLLRGFPASVSIASWFQQFKYNFFKKGYLI